MSSSEEALEDSEDPAYTVIFGVSAAGIEGVAVTTPSTSREPSPESARVRMATEVKDAIRHWRTARAQLMQLKGKILGYIADEGTPEAICQAREEWDASYRALEIAHDNLVHVKNLDDSDPQDNTYFNLAIADAREVEKAFKTWKAGIDAAAQDAKD